MWQAKDQIDTCSHIHASSSSSVSETECWIGWTRHIAIASNLIFSKKKNANPQSQSQYCFFFVSCPCLPLLYCLNVQFLLLTFIIICVVVVGSQLFRFMPIIHCILKLSYYFPPILITPLPLQVTYTLTLLLNGHTHGTFTFINFLS